MNSLDSFTNFDFESTFFLTNIRYDFFFNWQIEKKHFFGPIRNLFSLSTAQTEKILWTKLINQIGENI